MSETSYIHSACFANTVNIVNTASTYHNTNNILYLLMDRYLPVESAPEIDFYKVPEDAYDILSATSLIYLILTILLQIKTVVIQITKVTAKLI